MKNNYNIVTLSIFLVFLISGSSFAQLKSESWLWTLNLGFTSVESFATSESLSGFSYNTTIEKKMRHSPIAVGFNLSFLRADDQYTISTQGEKISSSISSTATFLTMKYLFSRSEIVPYIGLGLGLNFAKNNIAYTNYDVVQPASSDEALSAEFTSLAIAIPFGVNYFTQESIFVGLNVVPTWTDKNFFSSKWNFLFNLSLGFQF